jgi:hypothetical protein
VASLGHEAARDADEAPGLLQLGVLRADGAGAMGDVVAVGERRDSSRSEGLELLTAGFLDRLVSVGGGFPAAEGCGRLPAPGEVEGF